MSLASSIAALAAQVATAAHVAHPVHAALVTLHVSLFLFSFLPVRISFVSPLFTFSVRSSG